MVLAPTKCHWTSKGHGDWFDSGVQTRSIFGAQEDCGARKDDGPQKGLHDPSVCILLGLCGTEETTGVGRNARVFLLVVPYHHRQLEIDLSWPLCGV